MSPPAPTEQQERINALRAAVQDKLVDTALKSYCTEHTLKRYLVARLVVSQICPENVRTKKSNGLSLTMTECLP
jgi:hypothetical protein